MRFHVHLVRTKHYEFLDIEKGFRTFWRLHELFHEHFFPDSNRNAERDVFRFVEACGEGQEIFDTRKTTQWHCTDGVE